MVVMVRVMAVLKIVLSQQRRVLTLCSAIDFDLRKAKRQAFCIRTSINHKTLHPSTRPFERPTLKILE